MILLEINQKSLNIVSCNQPNKCQISKSNMRLLNNQGKDTFSNEPIDDAIRFLKEGKIVAIKGLRGFHLACDAENQEAIKTLRTRKKRPDKPFAVMVRDIDIAKRLCSVNKIEETILLSDRRPIVLLEKKPLNLLPKEVAPNMNKLGIMLPYIPFHSLLFQEKISCLIMTSGNVSTAPIEYEDIHAINNLGMIADCFLVHSRDIDFPIEDSVVKVVNNKEIVVRRGRDYTPFIFPIKPDKEVIALGAEEKSSFCISQNGNGYMSQYLGDLKNYESYIRYEKAIENLTSLLEAKPKTIAYDLHPSYMSSQYGGFQSGKKVAVQHHHAHMVSCMVEHEIYDSVIGVVFDGTGLGTDGKIWGGEFFIGNRESFNKVGHFRYVKLQGGDQAIKEPWRTALSYLYSLDINSYEFLSGINKQSIYTVLQALDKNLNCYESSSVGRLFDCVSSLLNLRHYITYDAQGAIELENAADPLIKEAYDFNIEESNEMHEIDYKDIILGILSDIKHGVSYSTIAAKFHNTIGDITLAMVQRLSREYKIKTIVLSGGVFENKYLLLHVLKGLEEKGYNVHFNQQVPTNDNGISVGQLGVVSALEGKE